MAHVLVKRGNLDNIVTYEHFCDTTADLADIDPKEINLGSTSIVLEGENGGIEIYIANSKKKWIKFSVNSSSTPEPEPEEPMDEEAIEEALDSDKSVINIKLNQPLNLAAPLSVTSGKTVTFDLNGQDINASGALFNVNGGTVIITGEGNVTASGNIALVTNGGKAIINGGTFDSTANNFGIGAIGPGSAIEFNDGQLSTTEGGLMAFDGGSITMNGGELITRDNFAIGTNGTAGRGGNIIIMNGGEINAHIFSNGYEAIGIYLPNDDTFVMNNGIINVTEGAGIVQRGGSCTIHDGTIICTGTSGKTGWVGDNKTKMSESAVIYHQTANYPAKDSIRLSITGGTFTGADHAVEILTNEENPRVSITGGTFNPPLA